MEDYGRHYLFSNGNVHVAYDPVSMSFCRLSEESWKKVQNNATTKEDNFNYYSNIENINDFNPLNNIQGLERFVLIVTTKCNLRCRYCYADSGTYGMPQKNMSPQTARQALDWILEIFPMIGTIQFFGGEPSFNWRTIGDTCEYLMNKHETGGLELLPTYGLVTNATVVPSGLLDIITRYGIHVTCSIDGPPMVHDANRVDPRGRGSFQRAVKGFNKLRERGVSLGVEMTFSPQTIEAGHNIVSLSRFSRAELGLSEPHIAPVTSQPGTKTSWHGKETEAVASYRQGAAAALRSLLEGNYEGFSFVAGILNALIKKRPRAFVCPAGASTLAVDPDGYVYPCFMFAGDKAASLGNVYTGSEGFMDRLKDLVGYNLKIKRATCRKCWAINLCSGCLGDIQISTGRLDAESPVMCNIMRAIAEEIMCFLAEIRDKTETWQVFVENYRRYRIGQEDIARQIV